MRNLLNLNQCNPHDKFKACKLEDLDQKFLSKVRTMSIASLPLGIRVFIKLDPNDCSIAQPFFQVGNTKPHVPKLSHAFAFSEVLQGTNYVKKIKATVFKNKNSVASFILCPEKERSLFDLYHSIKSYRKKPIPYGIYLEDPIVTMSLPKNSNAALIHQSNISRHQGYEIERHLNNVRGLDFVHYISFSMTNGGSEYFYATHDYKNSIEFLQQIDDFENYIGSMPVKY